MVTRESYNELFGLSSDAIDHEQHRIGGEPVPEIVRHVRCYTLVLAALIGVCCKADVRARSDQKAPSKQTLFPQAIEVCNNGVLPCTTERDCPMDLGRFHCVPISESLIPLFCPGKTLPDIKICSDDEDAEEELRRERRDIKQRESASPSLNDRPET